MGKSIPWNDACCERRSMGHFSSLRPIIRVIDFTVCHRAVMEHNTPCCVCVLCVYPCTSRGVLLKVVWGQVGGRRRWSDCDKQMFLSKMRDGSDCTRSGIDFRILLQR
ncbi:hypothetical protein TNIN_490931 [Trichonephila inaurata madagascariensis]|uniref:Uncharacterized protein n=1 Tax=Trichonephila inaurata madagascariensis TaxID=2747483 RepID=A0A8X6YQL4_9ARAC|nr:hypothetical protein TNIN_490931 [Trichonephila inaurata madagascariensis]